MKKLCLMMVLSLSLNFGLANQGYSDDSAPSSDKSGESTESSGSSEKAEPKKETRKETLDRMGIGKRIDDAKKAGHLPKLPKKK